MAASAYTDTVQKVYIAYYGRAADPGCLAFWSGQMDTNGGSLAAIMASFGASAEATTLYGSLTNTAMVNAIYKQSFGRDADFAGLMYYAGQLSAGTMTAVSIAQNIFDGAAGTDATLLANKLVVAKAYTAAINTSSEVVAYSGTVSAAAARTLLSTVDATTTTAGFDVATSITSMVTVANTAAVVAGKAFTLTSLTDTFVGGAGADVFTADNTATASASSTADNLTGGAGADTLNIFSDGSVDPMPVVSSIETINLYDVDDAIFTTATATGVETVNVIRGDGNAQGVIVAAGTTVNFSTITLAEVGTSLSVTHAAATTSATIGIDGLVGDGDTTNVTEDVTIVGAGLTTIVVNATGSTSDIEQLNVAGATDVTINASAKFTSNQNNAATFGVNTTGTLGTITVTGTGAVDIGTIDPGFTTVNAGANSGGFSALLATGDDTVLTGSSGNDTITASSTDALATADKLAVNAGEGTDTLVILATADVNTAADSARYLGFEKLELVDSTNLANFSDITEISFAGNSKTLSGLNAVQSAAITVHTTTTGTFQASLATATATNDVLTLNLTSATATTNVDVAGAVFTGYETVNINATTGVAATDSDVVFATAGDTSVINITGTADVVTTLTSTKSTGVAVTSTTTGAYTATGNIAAGSSVTSGSGADALTISTTLGSTYNSGAGADTITGALTSIVNTGVLDHVIDAGAGIDTLAISTVGATVMTDNHFTNISNMEKVTLATTASSSVTTGGAFNSAFADSVTITAASLADEKTFTYSGGLYGKDTTITLTTTSLGNAAAEDFTITTGAGADTVSITASSFVGQAGDSGSFIVDTRAGDDTITLSAGALLATTISQTFTVTPGTGADTVTLSSGANSSTVTAHAIVAIVDGDSLVASRDKITNFTMGDGSNRSDVLDFDSAAVGTLGTSTDFGVIKSHAIIAGVATFDDAATHATALVINSSNLADVLGYIEQNTAANDVIAFTYDSTGSGAVDATMVFHNDTLNSLVELVGVTTATSVATTAVTNLMIGIGA